MADAQRVRDPLELAAASPDPALRRYALDLKQKKLDLAAGETFLATYASLPANGLNGSAKPPERRNGDATGEMLRTLLLKAGEPLDVEALYRLYQTECPEDQRALGKQDSLRVALVRRKDMFSRGENGKWWPVDEPAAVIS